MQTCPECGAEARDTHSFCPECTTPLSDAAKKTDKRASSASASNGSEGSSFGDVSRRELMLYGGATVGTAAVGGGAGFLLLSGGSGGDPGDPAERARTFYDALRESNIEEAESMIHPNSPVQNIPPQLAGQSGDGGNVTIDSVETLQENETHAKVSIRSSATFENQTLTSNVTVPLEAHQGEWYVNVTQP